MIIVTGSSGLIGKALLDEYMSNPEIKEIWKFLTSEDGDLTKENDVYNIFEKYQPTCIVHLAANVGGLYKNMYQKSEMFEDNIIMNTLLFKYARKYKVKKIISILSTCIFPDGVQPLTEDKLHLGPPHYSNEGYAYAKRMMEVHGRILNEGGIQTIQLVPTNIFGPYDNFNIDNSHVIPALIHNCYLSKHSNKPFIVKGSGKPLRQFIYNKDLAKMIMWNVYHNKKSGMYICSPPSNQEISIGDVARQIAKCMEYENKLTFDIQYSDGQYKKTVEPNNIYNNFEYTDFSKALQYTVEWFIENYPKNKVRI
jgi:GDP-L-fucose synthase